MCQRLRPRPTPHRHLAVLAVLLGACTSLVGFGLESAAARPAYGAGIRAAVLRGAEKDFAEGTGVGGRSFRSCFEDGLRQALDPPTIDRLIAIYRRRGSADAAQELNEIGSPPAARCGHRTWVPELIHAADGLRVAGGGSPLRVTYGPYLGIRCLSTKGRRCDMVGIDVVLDRRAAGVEAIVGGRSIRLRTPGEHDGVRYRDWVGTFAHAGLGDPAGPFHFAAPGPVYVAVEVKATFVDGSSARVRFPHVLLAPGWG